eukprot:TRINITY_DN5763_c0_g1_i1.p1 TRINITY_DN5763_c0_g1~~TRINITY_DN5763_c0_g1_i1.p1  ORF type:complete len:745 (+),score=153.78 TRINITY_DN5763_c0_g1_i1:54-2288(+)
MSASTAGVVLEVAEDFDEFDKQFWSHLMPETEEPEDLNGSGAASMQALPSLLSGHSIHSYSVEQTETECAEAKSNGAQKATRKSIAGIGGKGKRASVAFAQVEGGHGSYVVGKTLSKAGQLKNDLEECAAYDPNSIERDELATAHADLTFKDVQFDIQVPDPDDPKGKRKMKKTILQNCCGHIPAGSLVALMGPSGCGKSTLMDILAKKKTAKYEGQIYINGHETDSMYPRITSYVSQDDIMPQHWTVREAVRFDAALKKPKPADVSWASFYSFVDTILEDLGLSHVQDTKIGGDKVRGISGGQKRRVTLARGIAANPALMFCDEPTSGLSGTDAELVVKTMVGMCRRWNISIFVVIHQPRLEVARLFDHLILLTSRPGRIVYNGPMKDVSDHWKQAGYPVPCQANPTDYVLDMVTPGAVLGKPDHFFAFYEEKQLPQIKEVVEQEIHKRGFSSLQLLEMEREVMSQFGALPSVRRGETSKSFFFQFRMLLARKVLLISRDTEVILCTYVQRTMLGLILGILFSGVGDKEPKGLAQMSFIFMAVCQITVAVFQTLPIIISQRTIMKMEVSEGLYSVLASVLAGSIVDTFLAVTSLAIQVTLMFIFAGMDMEKLPLFLIYCLTLSMAMEALALAVGCYGKHGQAAQTIAMPPVMIFLMYSGFLVSEKSSPDFLKWMLDASPVCWSMQLLAHHLYGDDEVAWKTLEEVLGYKEPSIPAFFTICGGLFVVSRILQTWVLKHTNNIAK